MTVVAGVDVGGTRVRACVLNPTTGVVLAQECIASRNDLGGAVVLKDSVDLVQRLAADTPLDGVGLGLCEFVSADGVPKSAFTIDWRDLDLQAAFAELGPVHLESDVRAAALAEGRFGAGHGADDPWLYVSVGTGISYSLVIDQRPFLGARGNAIVVGAPPVEVVAGGLALEQRTGRVTAEDVLADPALAAVVAEATAALGRALATLVNALDPALVVVGGGLGLVASYRNAAIEAMRPEIQARDTRTVPVVPAALGSLAGAVGAAVAGVALAGRL